MFSIKRIFKAALLTVVVSLTACTEKLETGSLLRDFTGAEGVEVLSPTAVRVYWQLHSRYREYKVYYNLSSEAVAETFQDSVIIRNLSPNTAYTFKVVGTDGTNSVGGNKEITVTTNKPFAGAGSVSKDADGNLILIWDYPNKVAEYQIFFKEYEDPTAANTSNWTAVDRTSLENRYIFRNMTGSTRYHFVVQAKYMDDTYERPTKVVTASTNSSFPTPAYELSPISIGALPFAKVTPVVRLRKLKSVPTFSKSLSVSVTPSLSMPTEKAVPLERTMFSVMLAVESPDMSRLIPVRANSIVLPVTTRSTPPPSNQRPRPQDAVPNSPVWLPPI